MRLPTKKSMHKKCHEAWREYIYKRDKFTCQWCKKKKEHRELNPHHIVPRSVCGNAGRYEVENGITLCVGCHLYKSKTNYVEFGKFIETWLKKRGVLFEELKLKYKGAIVKYTLFDLTLKYKILKDITRKEQ